MSINNLFKTGLKDQNLVVNSITVNDTSVGSPGMVLFHEMNKTWATGEDDQYQITGLDPSHQGYVFNFTCVHDMDTTAIFVAFRINGYGTARYCNLVTEANSNTPAHSEINTQQGRLISIDDSSERLIYGQMLMDVNPLSSASGRILTTSTYSAYATTGSAIVDNYQSSTRYNTVSEDISTIEFFPSSTAHTGVQLRIDVYRIK